MIAPARLAAYEALRAVSLGSADLATALARARRPLGDERDRALAGEIATGTLRWQRTFDHLVAGLSGRPLQKLDPEVLEILRLSLFQLLHLDRVPASALVNDAVQLARKIGKSSSASFVNAILRRASRERERLPLPPRAVGNRTGELDYLEVALSHPRWLVERWLDRYGFEAAETWCRFNNAAPPLMLRANRLRTSREDLADRLREAGIETEPARWAPDGLVVRRGNPLSTSLASQGLFSVQDEASQLVAVVAGATPGDRVFDACAAPGGKTTAMAADMQDQGLLISADVRAKRVKLLAETVRGSGASCVRVVQANAAQPLPFTAAFDLVLIDAPCSGLGTVRRDPDVKWRRFAKDFPALSDLQLRILRQAAEVVRPNGRLVYSTCSSEPEENDELIDRFVSAEPGFRRVPLQCVVAPHLIGRDGVFWTSPWRDGLEGFYACGLGKVG